VGRKSGFTLIELLIVIGICSLLLMLSFPTLASFRSSIYLEASARGVASELRKFQSLAESRNENLNWDLSRFGLPSGVVARNIRQFKFSSSGFPLPGGTGTQVLETQNGCAKKVILSSVGRVRIE